MENCPTSVRKLFIMRHAERVDFTFEDWIESCFDPQDNYIRKNLNMPITVPKRKGGPCDFFKDPPLTRIGLHQAALTGEAMKMAGVKFDHVFCSPALRCVETCTSALKASGQTHLPINMEPGLVEYLSFYKVCGIPKWMSLEDLKESGFNISLDYDPVFKPTDVTNTKESNEEYYMRSFLVTSKLLEKYSGNLFFVGHAASVDGCSRQLTGKPPRNHEDFLSKVRKATYASVAVLEQHADGSWHLTEPPFPPLMHKNNVNFEWKDILD